MRPTLHVLARHVRSSCLPLGFRVPRCRPPVWAMAALHRVGSISNHPFDFESPEYRVNRARFGRPLVYDLALPETSVIIAGAQYLSGLVRGQPPSSRCVFQAKGHTTFAQWFQASFDQVVIFRRCVLYLAASCIRRHGHLQEAPLSLVSIGDDRASRGHVDKLTRDRWLHQRVE